MARERVGIVGFGQMGAVVAERLHDQLDPVVVDVDPGRHRAAAVLYEVQHDAAAIDAPVVVLALPGPTEVQEVMPRVARRGVLVLDTTSIDPETAEAAGAMAASAGALYVEMPVLGGPPQAGSWVFLAGGGADEVSHAAEVMAPLGRVVHFGAVGAGSRAKLLNNILTGVNGAAVAEVLRLARTLGVDLPKLYDAITRSGSAGRNAVWEVRIPKILAGTLGDTFSIQLMAKDLDLATKLATHAAVDVPVAAAALHQYRTAAANGYAARDIGRLAEGLEN